MPIENLTSCLMISSYWIITTWGVFKNYCNWNCIHQDSSEKWRWCACTFLCFIKKLLFKRIESGIIFFFFSNWHWLIYTDWFNSMSVLLGLFYTKVILTIIVFSYIWYKKRVFTIILNKWTLSQTDLFEP